MAALSARARRRADRDALRSNRGGAGAMSGPPFRSGGVMPASQPRLSPALIDRYTRSGHWGHETFYAILARRAEAHPDRVAVIDHRGPVTYGELRERVDRVAAGLHQLGIGPGDVVTIQ